MAAETRRGSGPDSTYTKPATGMRPPFRVTSPKGVACRPASAMIALEPFECPRPTDAEPGVESLDRGLLAMGPHQPCRPRFTERQ